MPDKTANGPFARPKFRIAPRPIPRPKRLLPQAVEQETGGNRASAPGSSARNLQVAQSGKGPASPQSASRKRFADAGNATDEKSTTIRRKSHTELRAKSQGLGFQLNDILEEMRIQENELHLARALLEELRDNAPPANFSIPRTSPNPGKKPNVGRGVKSALTDIIIIKKNLQDMELHAARIAKQRRIVSKLKQVVEALEKQEREILAQIKDTVREREALPPEN